MMTHLLAALKQALVLVEIESAAAPILVDALGMAIEEGADNAITQAIVDAINQIADQVDVIIGITAAIQTAHENA